MARTIQEIQDQIIAEKDANATLSELNSTSQTAIWRVWSYVIAVAIWIHEKFFDAHKAEIEAYLLLAPPGSAPWHVRKCLEFQYGDVLSVVDDVAQYDTIDVSKRIVTRASYRENGGVLFLKVAKDGASPGTLQALEEEELLQLGGYLDRIQFAGVQIDLSSLNADKLRLYIDVYFDASYQLSTLKNAVRDAINDYLENLDFDGNVLVIKIVDAIQTVAGVKNVYVNSCEGYSGVNLEVFTNSYETKSGYIIEETATGFTFLDTMNFIVYQ